MFVEYEYVEAPAELVNEVRSDVKVIKFT